MAEEHLVVLMTLMIRLGVVAALASILVRSNRFKRMLLREQRTLNQRLLLALSFSSIFGAGVAVRVVQNSYKAVDLGLECSLVAGLLGGYVTGALSGALIALPAMFHHEYLTLPLLVGVGAMGGLLRDGAPDTEEIWRFSPFFDLSLYRVFARRHDHVRAAFQLVFLLAILFAEFLRLTLGHIWPNLLFSIYPNWPNPHPLQLCGRLRLDALRSHPAAQDLEQHPERDEARGAAAAAAAGAHGRPQPARSTRISFSTR